MMAYSRSLENGFGRINKISHLVALAIVGRAVAIGNVFRHQPVAQNRDRFGGSMVVGGGLNARIGVQAGELMSRDNCNLRGGE